MKKVIILLDTKENDEKIKGAIYSYFKGNNEEHLIKKLEVNNEV